MMPRLWLHLTRREDGAALAIRGHVLVIEAHEDGQGTHLVVNLTSRGPPTIREWDVSEPPPEVLRLVDENEQRALAAYEGAEDLALDRIGQAARANRRQRPPRGPRGDVLALTRPHGPGAGSPADPNDATLAMMGGAAPTDPPDPAHVFTVYGCHADSGERKLWSAVNGTSLAHLGMTDVPFTRVGDGTVLMTLGDAKRVFDAAGALDPDGEYRVDRFDPTRGGHHVELPEPS